MKKIWKVWVGNRNDRETLFLVLVVFSLIVCIGIVIFLGLYDSYIDRVLYRERLSQMKEVTSQLFTGLEDVVQNQWDQTDSLCNFLTDQRPQNAEELLSFVKKQSGLNEFDQKETEIVVIDALGRYMTEEGWQGTLEEMNLLMSQPQKISFVSKEMTTKNTHMYFLKRLEEPLFIQDGERTVQILYYGIKQDMTQLDQYFNCEVYDDSNSVYVLDRQGMRIFRSSRNNDSLLRGYNVFQTLEKMNYLHENSFDDARRELDSDGYGYANAVLEGEEYFYAMYRMEHAEWTLLFLVPAVHVATNVVSMVRATVRMILIFAMILLAFTSFAIYLILQVKKRQAVDAEHRNNEALASVNEKLSQAVSNAERAEQEAKRANRAKSNFLTNMSHDIRTPMNVIVGITTLMEHDCQNSGKMGEYTHKLKGSSQYLLSLINDVLDMSKIESGEFSLYREPLLLAEQVWQVESIIRPQIEERRQTFLVRVHEIVHEYLIGDSVRLRQIFVNLLSNAVKYTSCGGTISLDLAEVPCAEENHAMISITVTDNGFGMSEEMIAHIYEPFKRAENSTTNKVQGTGLGMAITKNIVDAMGGTIDIQSEPEQGSSFCVTIPFEIDRNAELKSNVKSVLLVTEDETLIRNAGASFAESGILFLAARGEADAKKILQKHSVETILLSGHFQGEKLSDLVQRLHQQSREVLFCADYDQQKQVGEILKNSGVDGLLIRPFFLSDFIAKVNEIRGISSGKPELGITLKGLRFLCAEDNELNAEILEALLTMHGASCVIYPDGKALVQAFEQMKPDEFDAILMDVQMPVMNGFEATAAIRRKQNGKNIPIIAMTANAFSSDIQACLDAGMDAYVAKPLEISYLERALESAMAKKR